MRERYRDVYKCLTCCGYKYALFTTLVHLNKRNTVMEVSVHWHDYTSSSVSLRQTSSVAGIMTSLVALLLLLLDLPV